MTFWLYFSQSSLNPEAEILQQHRHLDAVNADIPGSSVLESHVSYLGASTETEALGTHNRLTLTPGFQEMDGCAGG